MSENEARDISNFVNVGAPTTPLGEDSTRVKVLEIDIKRMETANAKLANENTRLKAVLLLSPTAPGGG